MSGCDSACSAIRDAFCDRGRCWCLRHYPGCTGLWAEWLEPWFSVKQVVLLVMHAILLCMIVHRGHLFWSKHLQGRSGVEPLIKGRFALHFPLGFIALERVLFFAIDPYAGKGQISAVAGSVLYGLGLWGVFATYAIVVWLFVHTAHMTQIDLSRMKRQDETVAMRVSSGLLYAGIPVFLAVELTVRLLWVDPGFDPVKPLYYVFIILCVLFVGGWVVVLGLQIRKQLAQHAATSVSDNNSTKTNNALRKIYNLSVASTLCIVINTATVGMWVGLAPQGPTPWLLFQTFWRLLEVAFVCIALHYLCPRGLWFYLTGGRSVEWHMCGTSDELSEAELNRLRQRREESTCFCCSPSTTSSMGSGTSGTNSSPGNSGAITNSVSTTRE